MTSASIRSLGRSLPYRAGLFSSVFTDIFSPSEYGRFALTLSIATILATVFFGWISESVLRFEPQTDKRPLVQTTNAFVLTVGGVFTVLAMIVYILGLQELGPFAPLFVAGSLVVVTNGSFYVYRALLRAQLKSKSVVGYTFVQATGELCVSLFITLTILHDVVGWFWGSALASVFSVGLIAARSGFVTFRPRIHGNLARKMVIYGVPLIGWLSGQTLLSFGDRVLVELLRGSTATGIYSSNYSIAHYGLMLAFAPFTEAAQPILMNLWEGNNESEIASQLTNMTRYFLIIGTLATVLFAIVARYLSSLLLGPAYLKGAVIMPVLAVSLFIWNASKIGQKGIEIKHQTNLLFRGILAAFVLNMLVNIPLIMVAGYFGAAIGTLISMVAYAVFIHVRSRRHISWRIPLDTLLHTSIAALCSSVPFILLTWLGGYGIHYRIVTAILCVPIYFGILYLSGEIKTNEITKLSGRAF